MLRKVIIFMVALVILTAPSFCTGLSTAKNSIGLDAPLIGWLQRNTSGQIEANLGVNWGLGISYRRYFNPLQANQFNPYWEAGTVLILIPYLGIGGDYVWDNGFYVGGGLIWIVPEIHGGYMF